MAGLPETAEISAWAVDADRSDELWLLSQDFLTPSRLMLGSAAEGAGAPTVLKVLPPQFDAKGLEVQQHEAVSKDGTKIPYFQIGKKGLKLDGRAPTLLDGYGGFEASMTPGYDASIGTGWLEQGGVYVVANIRGGGEFGPTWHTSALRENRHLVYEDFAAVADDLVARKVTSPRKLAAIGGSNGGLLVGNMLTQYPEKFGAIVCQVPLLDMKRYSHLLAGASWMEEYGDPDDPEQWKFIQTFSPYHLAQKDASYPPVFFLTSTRDDRVHPGHARKMAAKLLEWNKSVWYWENTVGGHGGATTPEERATMWALTFRFLWDQLGGKA
jgi:prolyl oligopeptidase